MYDAALAEKRAGQERVNYWLTSLPFTQMQSPVRVTDRIESTANPCWAPMISKSPALSWNKAAREHCVWWIISIYKQTNGSNNKARPTQDHVTSFSSLTFHFFESHNHTRQSLFFSVLFCLPSKHSQPDNREKNRNINKTTISVFHIAPKLFFVCLLPY